VSTAGRSSAGKAPARAARRGRFWAFLPVGLLGAILCMHAVLLAGVLDDPSFSVESDYYQKAVSWDAKMAQDRDNARLGWSAEITAAVGATGGRVAVALRAPGDVPIERARVGIEALHNARASRVHRAALEEIAPGLYASALPLDRPGLWEFRVVAEKGADRFTQVVRRDVTQERAP
jgi:nitrogen fixation protein FixH